MTPEERRKHYANVPAHMQIVAERNARLAWIYGQLHRLDLSMGERKELTYEAMELEENRLGDSDV